jgi:integrase
MARTNRPDGDAPADDSDNTTPPADGDHSPSSRRAGKGPVGDGTTYKDKHGQWWASLGSGKDRRTVRCPKAENSERGARRLLARLQEERRQSQDARSGRQTVTEFAQARINAQAEHLKARSLRFEQQMLELYLLPVLGHKRLDRVAADDIDRLLAKLRTMPRADGREGTLSPRTVRHAFNAGKRLFDEAVRRRAILWNPFTAVRAPRVQDEENEALTDEQLRALLLTAADHRYSSMRRLYPICLVAVVLGLREGEVLGLRRRDYNEKTATLAIAQQVQTVNGETSFDTPKTKRSKRSVPVPSWLASVLREQLDALEAAEVTSDLLFPSDVGTPIMPRNLVRDYHKLQRYANIERVSFHQLRHTAATRLAALGTPQAIIAGILGHALPGVTGDYTHAQVETMRPWLEQAAETLRALLAENELPQRPAKPVTLNTTRRRQE